MANRSRFIIAKEDILRLFHEQNRKVYSIADADRIIAENRGDWRLAVNMTTEKFIDKLVEHSDFSLIQLDFEQPKQLLVHQDASIYDIALSIRPNSHISLYSALAYHNLTEQHPKTIYVRYEQLDQRSWGNRSLSQEGIDKAFSRPQRKVHGKKAAYGSYMIYLVEKRTPIIGLGIEEGAGGVKVASIERTLIDIVVRPAYGGGSHETLKAFKAARELISVNKMAGYLSKLNLLYPYAHAIGFYLEKAGYAETQTDIFLRRLTDFKFYLNYGMNEPMYSEKWRVFYPKSL